MNTIQQQHAIELLNLADHALSHASLNSVGDVVEHTQDRRDHMRVQIIGFLKALDNLRLSAPVADELTDEALCQMAAKAFGKVVDYDLRGNPITDYGVLLMGAYGPAVRRLVELARAYPVPPADGDVEVLACASFAKSGNIQCWSLTRDHASLRKLEAEGSCIVELIDRSHFTRLQLLLNDRDAEVDRLNDKYQRDVFGLNNEGDPIGGDPAAGYANDLLRLKSELTKARELFRDLISSPDAVMVPLHLWKRVQEFAQTNTSNQSHCPHDGICHASDETCDEAKARIASAGSGAWERDMDYRPEELGDPDSEPATGEQGEAP
ncbi:hypothetical protein Pfra02_04360 [Pseudomonas fragi]|nr:hypothetical protein Pfra02_04360 [Pseudomonas fragi]